VSLPPPRTEARIKASRIRRRILEERLHVGGEGHGAEDAHVQRPGASSAHAHSLNMGLDMMEASAWPWLQIELRERAATPGRSAITHVRIFRRPCKHQVVHDDRGERQESGEAP